MIGEKQVILDASDFSRGMSTNAYTGDGGFSNETEAINLIAEPGVLHMPAAMVDSDTDTRLTGLIIATCPDMTFTSPTNRLAVSDDGKAYRYNGTKLDAAGISLTAAQTWTAGFTDIITYGGEAYVSSKGSLTRWQNDNTIDAGGSWPFSFGTATVPHPGIVYENNMYWGDKNLLLIQSAVGDAVAPTTILTLSADQMIVALGVDPASGLMLISTKNTLDVSGTIPTINRLFWYDGNSAKVSRSAIIDDGILGFHNVGNTVYVGYGNNLGYLSGAGVVFLRKLKNVTADNTELPYKHHMAHVANTLYVIDGKQVLAHGEILPGRKAFYYALSNTVNSNKFSVIAEVGSKKLGVGFATTKFYTFDTATAGSTGTLTFYGNKIYFPRPIKLYKMRVFTTGTADTDTTSLTVSVFDEKATVLPISNASRIKTATATTYVFDFDYAGGQAQALQPVITPSNSNYGIVRIIFYYSYAE